MNQRSCLVLSCLALLAAAVAPLREARAHYEVLELKSDRPRVAVVVLAFNDDELSYFGQWIYERILRASVKNRYSKLYITRGKHLDAGDIREAMTAALGTGLAVDFMSNTHSSAQRIKLRGKEWIRPYDLIAPTITDANRGQLDFAANFGCYSETQYDQFKELGFRTFIGNYDVSVGSFAMSTFLDRWLKRCDSMSEAVTTSNRKLTRLFTKNILYKQGFKMIAKKPRYKAVLRWFGDDQKFCD